MHSVNGMNWGMGWWWIIIGIIVVMAFFWPLAKRFIPNNSASQEPRKSALDSLNERYAKGEISKEEYEEIKSSIS